MLLKLIKYTCFNKFNLETKKEKVENLHERIKEDKDFLYDFFEQQPYFKESMPTIQKFYKGVPYYKGLIKGGVKGKSPLFKAILKAIKEIEEEMQYPKPKIKYKKLVKLYSLPKIEILKRRIKKMDNYYKSKPNTFTPNSRNQSTVFNKSIKYTFSSSNFNKDNRNISQSLNNSINNIKNKSQININKKDNTINCESDFLSTGVKSIYKGHESLSPGTTQGMSNLSVGTSWQKSLYNLSQLSLQNNIIKKCKEEIIRGKLVSDKVNKFTFKLNKKIQEKLKETILINKDQKLIEEKNKSKNKYKRMEENNIGTIKKKMNEKISPLLAYINRKEFYEEINNTGNYDAYTLFLKEMDKINEKLLKNKEIEEQKLNKVEELLNDVYKQKEYLKGKINRYYKNPNKVKEFKFWESNDDFYVTKNDNNLKGTLLPRLLELREKSNKNKNFGNFLGVK